MGEYRGDTVMFTIAIQDSDHKALVDLAEASGETVSWLAWQAIREMIARSDAVHLAKNGASDERVVAFRKPSSGQT